jgi:hypothetical protein
MLTSRSPDERKSFYQTYQSEAEPSDIQPAVSLSISKLPGADLDDASYRLILAHATRDGEGGDEESPIATGLMSVLLVSRTGAASEFLWR